MLIAWGLLFVAMIAAEALLTRRLPSYAYRGDEVQTTIGLTAGWYAASIAAMYALRPVNEFAFHARIFDLGLGGVATAALVLVLGDFLYYWLHRLSHQINWFWATHSVHHTATRMTFLTTFRQGWTGDLAGAWVIWLPLGVIGIAPAAWDVFFLSLSVWQIWIHNEWAGRLGVLEYVLMTPSHHRVHHSLRPEHIDRNYGGILIVWDRLFGSFAEEGAHITAFGLAGQRPDSNPIVAAFRGWIDLFGAARRAPSWGQALHLMTVPPGITLFTPPAPSIPTQSQTVIR